MLVLTAFSDERPLSGLSGLVDWRLGGVLSDWLINGFATGRANERVLYPSQGRLSQRFVLWIGLGPRAQHRADRARAAAAAAATAVANLGFDSMVCGSFGLDSLSAPLERSLPELITSLQETPGMKVTRFAVNIHDSN
ncbi:MAG: M17 family peptidase N-terminal domain-containing protein [Myxococcota bacterium]|nr:M17 family peptidase N-terminal domain-containing protein [Myxococcota bacterium]